MTFNISTSSSVHPGTDDLFANSSTETVVENIDFSLILEDGNNFMRTTHVEGVLTTMEIEDKSVPQCPIAVAKQCLISDLNHSNMEASVITQMPCNSVNMSLITNQCVAEASNFPQKLYCPFCIQEYAFEFLLKEHIQYVHLSELNRILNHENYEVVLLQTCIFCHAKFYSKGVLLKHIVKNHENDVINILQNKSPEKYINCIFCPYKVLRKHKKLLIMHIEKKHCVEFEYFIDSHASNVSAASADHSSVKVPCTPGLSDLFSRMDTSDNVITTHTSFPKPILKNKLNNKENVRRGLRFDDVSESFRHEHAFGRARNVNEPQLQRDKSSAMEMKKTRKSKWKSILSFKRKNNIEKELQCNKIKTNSFVTSTPKDSKLGKFSRNTFSSNSPVIAQYYNTKTTEHALHQGYKPKKRVSFKSHVNKVLEGPVGSIIDLDFNEYSASVATVKQFKCGLCLQAFTDNGDLLHHKKKQHRGPLHLLHPHYRCGECEAKFYRNSFLVRHCEHHHTPLCLRNKRPL